MAKGDIQVGKDADGVDFLPASTDTHVLTLDSAEVLGVKWAAGGGGVGATGPTGPTGPGGIDPTIMDAKGDLITATAADTPVRLPVGTDGFVLTSDSAVANGIKWSAQSGSTVDGLLITRAAALTLNSGTQTDIPWDTETTDTAGLITVTSTTLTIPSGKGGVWTLAFTGTMSAGTTARAFIHIVAGGVAHRAPWGLSDDTSSTAFTQRLADADTIVVSAYQVSGTNRTLTARLEMHRIGA